MLDFGCKTAATKAMAQLMIDYKKFNKSIMQYAIKGFYELDTPPKMTCRFVFLNRLEKKTKTVPFLMGFSSDDEVTIDYLEDTAELVDELRKTVQAWYGCGIKSRKTINYNAAYPSKATVKAMVRETIEDERVRELFLGLLDEPRPTQEEAVCIESILNGSFVVKTTSCTAFHYCPQLLEFGFPKSKSKACLLNRTLWDDLIRRTEAKGHSRRDVLAKFILVWAAMDGSILHDRLEVIIPDDPQMITFFREIFHEQQEGVP